MQSKKIFIPPDLFLAFFTRTNPKHLKLVPYFSNFSQKHYFLNIILFFLLDAYIYFYQLSCGQVLAGPQTNTNHLKAYEFGSGGITGNISTTYSLFGNTGQIHSSSLNSTTFAAQPGLTYLLLANVPGAPTLSIPANNY